jgi:hypothetical protein
LGELDLIRLRHPGLVKHFAAARTLRRDKLGLFGFVFAEAEVWVRCRKLLCKGRLRSLLVFGELGLFCMKGANL